MKNLAPLADMERLPEPCNRRGDAGHNGGGRTKRRFWLGILQDVTIDPDEDPADWAILQVASRGIDRSNPFRSMRPCSTRQSKRRALRLVSGLSEEHGQTIPIV